MPIRDKVYDKLKSLGLTDSKEDFFKYYDSDENVRKDVYRRLREDGLRNSEEEFYSAMKPQQAMDEQIKAQSSNEPYTHVYDKDMNLIGGTAYQAPEYSMPKNSVGRPLPSLSEQVNAKVAKEGGMKFGKPGFVQDEATALHPMSGTSLADRLSNPRVLDENNNIRAVQEAEEEKEIDKTFVSKPMNTAKDVYDNYGARFTNTQRGIELGEELAAISKGVQDKYVKEYLSSDQYKALKEKYQGEELAKQANDQFALMYGEVIEKEMEPYQKAYNDELSLRYGSQMEGELNRINKEEAGVRLNELSASVDTELEAIEKRITDRTKAVRNDSWKPGMPSVRDDKGLAELRGQRTYLDGAKELIEESQKIINAANDAKDGTAVGGVLRGVRDKAFDIDTWTMGLSDLVGGMRLNNILEKVEKGDKLTPAEEMLFDASVNNMAINYYYQNDLGKGYMAGQITGESLPFMLEMIVNPISASGNAIAKRLLNAGLKKFAKKKSAQVGARLIGDATAALGMASTTGMPSIIGDTYRRMNENYNYGVDAEGNLYANKKADAMGIGEAFTRSFATRAIENQSEMIFNAFKGVGGFMKGVQDILPGGVNRFFDMLSHNKVADAYRWLKNSKVFRNYLVKDIRNATQIGGLGEEYLEEVYNNLANFAIGEMSWEDVTSLDKNIDTLLGLAPTQVMFGILGLGGAGAMRYQTRRTLEDLQATMNEQQRRELEGLLDMGIDAKETDVRGFIRSVMANQNYTVENKRDLIKAAYYVAKQKGIDEMAEADVVEKVNAEYSLIDSMTDPSTGTYAEVNRLVINPETGEREAQPGYVVGWIGEGDKRQPIFVADGMENTYENRMVLKPTEWEKESYQEMPAEQVKTVSEEMIREEATQQAEQEAKYAPEVLNAQMQQDVPFVMGNEQLIPFTLTPEGNGWEVEVHPIDEKGNVSNKVTKTRVVTNDEYRDMLQAQLEAKEAIATPMSPMESQESTPMTPMSENVQPVAEGVATEQQAPVIPTKEDGSIDFVSYGKEGTFKTLGDKYGEKMPNKVAVTAKALAEDLKKAQNKLQKAEEAYDNAPIGREQKAEEVRDKAKQELEAIQREANFWAEMDAEIKDAQARRESMLNPQTEVETSTEPMNVDEFVAQQLASGNIVLDKEDYKKETGYGDTEANAMNGGAIKLFGKNGMTIQEAGERLMEMDRENGTNFFDQSDPNAGRDALLSVLASVRSRKELNQYIAENRKSQSAKESEGLRNELEKQVVSANYASLEDYVLQMEAAEMENPFDGIDVAQIDAIFAEAEEEYQQYLNSLENGQGTTSEAAEGSDNVLPEEQSDNTGGTSGIESEGDSERNGEGTLEESEGAYEEGEDVKSPIRERAKDWENKLGVKVNLIESIDQVTNREALIAIQNGQRVTGWFEESTGEVCFYMSYLESENEVDSTYIHEVVAHKGLRELLGDKFDAFCDEVWDMMSNADRLKFMAYPGVSHLEGKEKARAAADEYIAHLAENIDVTDSVWSQFTELIKKFLKAIGLEPKMTNADIANTIKRSYQRLLEGDTGSSLVGEGTRFSAKKISDRRKEINRLNNTVDQAVSLVTGKDIKEVKAERIEREQKRKEDAAEIYQSVLSGDFNDVTLQKINDYIDDATPLHPYGQRISQRLPQKLERGLHEGARTNAVDALFSRICESAVPASRRSSEAGRREIEERKKEALKGWAIATNNWHTDLSDFADEEDFIRQGTDSKVYLAKDGKHVIKVSFGKPEGKRFRPDIDTTALFNSVFRNTAYEIVGYGEFDGKFARILKQPFVDFADKTALNADEREEYMRTLGFEPINESRTAFSNGSIVAADLQKSNILKDAAGNISVIDADMKLHTKDVGGNYTYPPVEADLPEGKISFRVVNDKNGKKNLVGLHNISEEKLRKAIRQGGLANPSMAVINMDKQSHVEYGDITLIAPESLVDKKTGKNVGTYMADAYTPIYPTVTKQMSNKGAKALTKALETVDETFRNRIRLYFNNYLDSGTMYDALFYWYLSDIGKNPPILEAALPDGYTREEVKNVKAVNPEATIFAELSEEERRKVIDLYIEREGGKEKYEGDLANRVEGWKKSIEDENALQMRKKFSQDKLNELEEYGYEYNRIANYYKYAINLANASSKPSEIETFRNAYDEVVKNGLKEDFGNWLMAKEEELGVEEKLFTGYDNQGRAKYVPNTLENASKLMKKEGRAGATGLGGFNYFVAILAPVAKNTKQISAKKQNLSTQEEYDRFAKKWGDHYHKLALQLQPGADKWADYGYHRLHEIAPMANPKEYVKKEYGIELSDKFIKDLNDVKNAIRNDFPARYFETKFERPVYLNEFAAAVVPEGVSEEIVNALSSAGLPVEYYEKDNNEARMEAVDKVSSEIDGVRFRFIGERGARNLDKAEEATTRLDNLAVAREMEAAEKDAKAIKMATGWERGADGLWRYEVDDNIDFELRRPKKAELKKAYEEANEKYYKLEMRVPTRTPKNATEEEKQRIKDMRKELAKLRKGMNKAFDAYYDYSDERATLGEFLGKDNQLFKEYPELADYEMSFLRDSKKLAEGLKGSFAPEYKLIWVDDARPKGDIKSTLIHEIQHAIQGIEGFAHGSTPAAFASAKYQAEDWKANFNEFISRYGFEDWSKSLPIEDWMKYGKEYKGQFGGLHRAFIDNAVEDEDVKKTLTKELDYVKAAYDKFYQIAGGMDPAYKFKNANEWYRSLSGEVESRNVQQRMGMTDEQRRNTLAESTEDVAREDQVFLKDGIESGETRFRSVNEPAVDYVSQANDVVEVPRDEVMYTMNNIANQLYKTSGRFMRQLYKYGTIGRVLKGEYAEIDQIKAKQEYDHAKPILEEYLNELVWTKYQATEAAQEVINDVISDVEYAMQYYKDLSLGKDVWRTNVSPRFRISDYGKQVKAEVDKVTSKYNSKDVMFFDSEMTDEEISSIHPDLTREDVMPLFENNVLGGYSSRMDNISIFANNVPIDNVEDTIFHENVHALLQNGQSIIDAFAENALERFPKNVKRIQERGYEEEVAEELLVRLVAKAMVYGIFDDVSYNLPESEFENLKVLLKDFGYEYEQEIKSRALAEGRRGTPTLLGGEEIHETRGVRQDTGEQTEEKRTRKEELGKLIDQVADMGLEGVLGNKEYTSAMVDIYKALPNEVRAELADDALRNYGGSIAPAVSDYLNVKAEPSVWDKVVTIVREALRKIGFDLDLNANEVRYMAWRSKKPLDRNNMFEVAEDIDMRYRLKVGEYDGSPTPDGGGTRFRVSGKLNVRDEYEATIKKGGYQAREAVQDAMLSLRKFQELIEKASGEKIRDFENAWMHENRLSSVVQAKIHDMERKFYKPMMDAVKKLMKAANLEQEQVADYLMLKHGIERNREMAVRKALTDDKGKIDRTRLEQWYQDKRNVRNRAATPHLDTWRKQQEELDNIALLYGADMSRDYSGLTSMFDTDDIEECTNKAYDEVEALETAHPVETEALGKAIKAMAQNTLDESFGSGLMDRKVYNELSKDMYDYYIPLRGFEETTSDEVYAYLDQDRGAFNAPLKRAKGRSSKSDNPLAYLKSIAESGLMQGERNKMKQSFLNLVINHPSDLVSVREGVWVVYNPASGEWEAAAPPAIPNNATPADVEAAMEAWEANMESLAASDPNVKKISEAQDIPYRVVGNRMNQHQVIVKRLGKSYTLTINGNPRLAMALNGLTNPNNKSNDGKVAAYVSSKIDSLNRTLSAWYTTRNPDFVASNFMRDTFYTNTIVRAKEGNAYANKFHKNYGKVLPQMLILFSKYEKGTLNPADKTEAAFLDFMMNGGETGYSNLKDLEHIKKQIAKELKESKWDKAVTAVNLKALRRENVEALAEKVDILNRAVENTARFAAFLTSREEGRSIAKSVFDAKEISVNFNKKGAGGTFFGMTGQTWFGNLAAMVGAGGRALYVFFNAAVQGTTNLMHVMKVNPKGTSDGLAAMFLMGAVVPFLFGGDDDDEKDYYDLPEHVRRNHLIIPGTGDAWISIPLPIEYRIMYGMGELLSSWRTGHERGSDIARKMLSMTGQALPLNFLEEGLEAFVPSAASPIYQVMTNSSWTGLPIYKENDFNKDDPEYTKAYSNVDRNLLKFTKALYEWTFDEENQEEGIDLNPAIIETLAKGYFGGLATQLSNLAKVGGMIAGEQEFDWRNIPIGNRILKTGDERTKEKRVNNEYFENMEKLDFLQSRERRLKKAEKGVAVPEADKFNAQKDLETMQGTEIYKKYQEFKKLKKKVDKIRKTMKEKGSTPEREKQLMEAQEAANKAVR